MGSSTFADLERLRRLGVLGGHGLGEVDPAEDETAASLGLAPLDYGGGGGGDLGGLPLSLSPDFLDAINSAPPLPSPSSASPLRTGWSYLTSPLRAAIGYTGTLVPQVIRAFDPDSYRQAAEELKRGERVGPAFAQEAEELPALGDVLSQYVSPETRESLFGKAVGPAARMGLNILGDPTSYIGWGLLPKLAAAGRVRRALGGMEKLEKLEELGKVGAVKEAVAAALRAPSVAGKIKGAGRLGIALPISPFAGLAYAPELVEGVAAGAGQTLEEVQAGRYAEAAASGANTLLMGGLGVLVARGVISEAKAVGVAERAVREHLGIKDEAEAQTAQQLSPRQILEQATEEGTIEERPAAPAPTVVEPAPAPPTLPPTPTVAQPPAPLPGVGVSPAGPGIGPVPTPTVETHPIHGWLDERVGQVIKKSDVVAAGFISKKKGKGGIEAAIADAAVQGRLRYVDGKGYEVLPRTGQPIPPQAVAQAAAPAPAPIEAPSTALPAPLPTVPDLRQPVEEATIEPVTPVEEAVIERVPGVSLTERVGQIGKLAALGYDRASSLPPAAAAAILERSLTPPQLTQMVDEAIARAETAGVKKLTGITAEIVPESWLRGLTKKAFAARAKAAAAAEAERTAASTPSLEDQLRASITPRREAPSAALSIDDILSAYPNVTREQAVEMLQRQRAAYMERERPFPQEPAAPIRVAQAPWEVNPARLTEEERSVGPVSLPPPRTPLEQRVPPPEIEGRPIDETAARLPEPATDAAPVIASRWSPEAPRSSGAAATTPDAARIDRVVSDLRRYIGETSDSIRGVRRSPIRLTERTPSGEEFVSVPALPREGRAQGLSLDPKDRGNWIYQHFILDESGDERFDPAAFKKHAEATLGRKLDDPSITTADLHYLLTEADRNPEAFGSHAPRISELDPAVLQTAAPRLVGGDIGEMAGGGFRYDPASPAGQVLSSIRRSGGKIFGLPAVQAEDALQNTLVRWLSDVSGKGAERAAANARARATLTMVDAERVASELEAKGYAEAAELTRAEARKKGEKTIRWAESKLRADATRRRLLLSPIITLEMDARSRDVAIAAARKELASLLTSDLKFAGYNIHNEVGKKRTKDAFVRASSLTDVIETRESHGDAERLYEDRGVSESQVRGGLQSEARSIESLTSRAAALTSTPTTVAGKRPASAPPSRYQISFPERPPTLSPASWLASISLDRTLLRPVLQSLSELRRREHVMPNARQLITKFAQDVGVAVRRDSNQRILDNVHNKIYAALDPDVRAGVEEAFKPSAATDFLDDELVSQRGAAWRSAVDRSPRIGDTDARIVDFEGDGGAFLPILRSSFGADYADTLSRVVADAAATTNLPTRFGGLTPSLLLDGVRLDDAAYHNPLQAWRRAEAVVSPGLEGDARLRATTHLAARNVVDNILHELKPHRHSTSTGDIDFGRDYANLFRSAAPIYSDLVRRVEDALLPISAKIDASLPAYRTAFEGVADRVRNALAAADTAAAAAGREGALGARPRSRTGEPVARAVEPRPGEGAGGAGGGGGSRIRPASPLLGDGAEAAPGVRPGAAAQPGPPAGGVGGAGRAGRGGGGGDGDGGREAGAGAVAARPSASIIDLGTDLGGGKKAREVVDHFARFFADQLAKYSNQPDAGDRYLRELQAVASLPTPTQSKLVTGGPKSEFDIGLNIRHLDPTAMSDEQRMVTAVAVKMFEAAQKILGDKTSRQIPYTRADLRTDMIKLLDYHTPEEFIDLSKTARMIDSPAKMALLKTVHATFAADVDLYRGKLRTAEADLDVARRSGVSSAIETAQSDVERMKDLLSQSVARSEHALYTLLPHTTRVARMLQALNNTFTPLSPDESFRSRFLGAMKNSKIGKEKALEFWDMFSAQRALGSAANWTEFVNAFRKAIKPSFFERFLEFWKAGLLGIPTHIVNISTTGGFLALRNIEQAVSIPMGSAFSLLTGKPKERYLGEIAARVKGTRLGLKEAFTDLRSTLTSIARLEPPDPLKQFQMGTFHDEPNLRQLYGAIGGKPGEFVRIPFKLLDAFDNFFKHIIRNQEWAARANRIAHDPQFRTGGESVSHASDRISDDLRRLASNPFGHYNLWKKPELRAAVEAGRDAAIKDTFQEALAGTPFRRAVEGLREATRALPALEFVQPFWKTPYNILAEAMKRTPAGVVMAINQYRKGAINNPEFVEAMVKSGLGIMFMTQAATLALQGNLTGGGPTDTKERELKKRTGWQPYSFKIGNDYYSYRRFAPFSVLLGTAADMAEAWGRKDISSTPELFQKGVQSVVDNIMDQTFITGLDSLTKLLTDPGGEGLSSLRQYEASLVPNIVGIIPVAHAARALDPTYRETQALTASPIIAQIPGLSKTLSPQLTPTGELRQRPGTPIERLLSPVMRSTAQTGPVADAAEEIVRLGKSLEPTPLFFRVGDERVYYDNEERMAIARSVERGLRDVARLIRKPSYRSLPDAESPDNPNARTKYDVILATLSKHRSPVTARARRTAARRFEE